MRLVLNVHDDDDYFPDCSRVWCLPVGTQEHCGRPDQTSQVTASSSAQGQLGLKIVILTIAVLVSSKLLKFVLEMCRKSWK